MSSKNIAIVINGKGGVGKDTLCDAAAQRFAVKNVSSITPIKEIAAQCGWDGSKDDKSRKFLADLKQLCVDYNNYPTLWAKNEYDSFLQSDSQIMFLHVREPEEIAKFVSATDGRAKTLLVRADKRLAKSVYGNAADDNVTAYGYDYYFDNEGDPTEMAEEFCALLERIVKEA